VVETAEAAAVDAQSTAEGEAQLATSRQLAAQALNHTDSQLDLALLLSVEAIDVSDTVEAQSGPLSVMQANPRLDAYLHGHENTVQSVAFSPDGTILASGSWDETVVLWDIASGQPIGEPLTGHAEAVTSVTFSPDGTMLASGSNDETIILWDVASRVPLRDPLSGPMADVATVAFSPDGTILASGDRDGAIVLWDVASGEPLGDLLDGHDDMVSSVAFDATGLGQSGRHRPVLGYGASRGARRVADHTCGWCNLGRFRRGGHDPRFGRRGWHGALVGCGERRTACGFSDRSPGSIVYGVAFNPDSNLFAAGISGGAIVLWDVESQQALGEPQTGHDGAVNSVAFNNDGTILASGGADDTIRVWHVASQQPFGEPLTGHAEAVTSVDFNLDGTILGSGSWDDTVMLWDIEVESWRIQPVCPGQQELQR